MTRSFLFVLLLSLCASALAAPLRRDSGDDIIKQMCGGFNVTEPSSDTITAGQNITLAWEQGASRVTQIDGIQLMYQKGLVKDFTANNTLPTSNKVLNFTFDVSDVQIDPQEKYMLRIWGLTDKGPHCIKYTQWFEILDAGKNDGSDAEDDGATDADNKDSNDENES
ncbi:uncharacterized protein VTP21DRAFT_2148 [Calcarisporiella thermophila]|uniref:uncharacterized protein n=1 Tax=Calcarisporiella thermophila TaxID=911321 RepID=UPI0037445C56